MAVETDLARGVAKFIKNIQTKLLSPQQKDYLSREYAKAAAQAMREHTRRGYGLFQDGNALSKLKALSPRYIMRRRAMRLSSETSPGFSNLTQQGHMLDSLTAKQARVGNWYVAMPGQHPNAKIANVTLARYLSRDRPFLYLSSQEQTKLGRDHEQRFATLVRAFGR